MRTASRAGLTARVVALLCVGLAGRAGATSDAWFRHYQDAERRLLAGDHAGAEQALLSALSLRPTEACRIRLYGIKYRDYVPYYYLGIAQQEQGRLDDARKSFERAVAEGVIDHCAGTKLQAFDLHDRLDKLDAELTPKAGGAKPTPAEVPQDLAALRDAAVAAGATLHSPERLAEGDAARAKLLAGDAGAAATARRAYEAALSRSRAEVPLAALLRQEAEESVEQAQLVAVDPAGLDAADVATIKEADAHLTRARQFLARDTAAETALEAEAAADAAARLYASVREELTLERRERIARLRGEASLLLALADDAWDALAPTQRAAGEATRARAVAERARAALAASSDPARLEEAVQLAGSARRDLAALAARAVGGWTLDPSAERREVLELTWSPTLAQLPAARLPPPTAAAETQGASP